MKNENNIHKGKKKFKFMADFHRRRCEVGRGRQYVREMVTFDGSLEMATRYAG
jgi:hypothetical protein